MNIQRCCLPLSLRIENGRILSSRRTIIPMTGEESDCAVADVIARQRAPYEQKMSAIVGHAGTLITRGQTIAGQEPEKRDAESPADDLFADAIRDTTGAEMAFLPGLGTVWDSTRRNHRREFAQLTSA